MKCEIGDIVLVNNFTYPDGIKGTLHNFVVMDIDKDEFTLVNLDYLCFLISSNVSKNNTISNKFPYNEPISPTEQSGLRYEGHVKCDVMFEKIKEDDIIMRVGTVTPSQYNRFKELYARSLEEALTNKP
ncbi:MAG: hypothetical protein FWE68_02610 [Defluviitaleaceae bacterium]|nr:hypothetical protein [Defluviitaleaceae bacterium]